MRSDRAHGEAARDLPDLPPERRRRFLPFYTLALLIVSAVVAARLSLDYDKALLALFGFLEENGLYANVYSIGRFALEVDARAWLIFLFAGAPTIAAIVLSVLRSGPAGLLDLCARLAPWRAGVSRRQGIRVYALIALIYGLGALGYLAATAWWAPQGSLEATFRALGGSLASLVFWLSIGPFLDEGGTLEELGWHGYGFPALFDRLRSPLRTALLFGVLWWAWHFPREIPTLLGSSGGGDLGQWAYYQGVFLAVCLALSVIGTWFWFRTGGSVLPVLLVHGTTNVWSKALAPPIFELTGQDTRTWLVALFAMLILVLVGPNLGFCPEHDPR